MVGFDETSKFLFGSHVADILRERNLSTEVVDLVPKVLGETYMATKADLGITFPIDIRTINLSPADQHVLTTQENGPHTLAFFVPRIANNKVYYGELVINDIALIAYSQSIERKGGGRPSTPWKLINQVAHEMRHGWQWEDNFDKSTDLQDPSDARRGEYDAREYAYQWISRQKPDGFLNRIGRAIELLEIKAEMDHISQKRRKLGLD